MNVTGPQLQIALQQLEATAARAAAAPRPAAARNDGAANFASALEAAIDKIDIIHDAAASQAQSFERGDPSVSLSNVMIDLQKASITFEMGVQVRNRLISAYRDIMNMRV